MAAGRDTLWVQIVQLVLRGYAVVAYSERELGRSEGKLTVASPQDIQNARRVIDWALANKYYQRYPSPKQLLGDHGTLETFWLLGLPASVTDAAFDWLDHYLSQVFAMKQIIGDGIAERLFRPRTMPLPEVDRSHCGVWRFASPLAKPARIAGIPRLRLSVTPPKKAISIYAYFLDLNPITRAMRIITHAPCTVVNHKPGVPAAVDLEFQPADHQIPAAHDLVLIIDAEDKYYEGGDPGDRAEPDGANPGVVTLSNLHGEAVLRMPMGPLIVQE
ncbi:CocE/NonD family hydrolase C-terminal non-catalytic domain-containing protein [Nocardia sp. NPDC127579]|uniref:CocE/NonD family hydrolase C-terminal non-catalytic domain-containing protein n=1 Tax=Nocardia sp. NPDC127579 TaxID=3345402 RepID=UPI003641DD0B